MVCGTPEFKLSQTKRPPSPLYLCPDTLFCLLPVLLMSQSTHHNEDNEQGQKESQTRGRNAHINTKRPLLCEYSSHKCVPLSQCACVTPGSPVSTLNTASPISHIFLSSSIIKWSIFSLCHVKHLKLEDYKIETRKPSNHIFFCIGQMTNPD